MKSGAKQTVFLFDVDNTLLDNDRVIEDLKRFLVREVSSKRAQSYWKIFEQLREDLGYADYLGALQSYRSQYPHDVHLLAVSRFLIEYPFANRLFPSSLDVLQYARKSGRVALLSDGDVVFQPRKVERSGLQEAVEGHVMIYVHKERELKDVVRRYPARHYVMVDDKLHILWAIKKAWGAKVTTVFARQGHYAKDPKILSSYPEADLAIDHIGELLNYTVQALTSSSGRSR
jgi:FMN phosphatase YigB (HAD superfamily)